MKKILWLAMMKKAVNGEPFQAIPST